MLIRFSCPHCERSYRGKLESIGKNVRCTECRKAFEVVPDVEPADPDGSGEAISAIAATRFGPTSDARAAQRAPRTEEADRPRRRASEGRRPEPRPAARGPSLWLVVGLPLGVVFLILGAIGIGGVVWIVQRQNALDELEAQLAKRMEADQIQAQVDRIRQNRAELENRNQQFGEEDREEQKRRQREHIEKLLLQQQRQRDAQLERQRVERESRGPQIRLVVVSRLELYTDAVISSNSTALIAYPGCVLKRIVLPNAAKSTSYVLPKDPYRMVLDEKRGLLFAICADTVPAAKPGPAKRPRPGLPISREGTYSRGLYGKGDLHVFDVSAVLKGELPDGSLLTPKHIVPVGGTVTTLLLSPDGAWVYFLDVDNDRIGRVDAAECKLQGSIDKLDRKTDVMCLTPDGKTLYAASHEGDFNHYNAGPYRGTVQKFDAATLKLDKSVQVNAHTQDIRATDEHLVFLSSGSGQHVGTTLVDMNSGAQKNNWCVSPGSDMLCLTPDQKVLFVNHGWHGTAHMHAVAVPKTMTDHAGREVEINPGTNYAARREMRMSPDGTFLLCDVGAVFRVERTGGAQ